MTPKPYRIVFKKSAVKDLEALPKKAQQKILDAIQLLAINPYTELFQIKKMQGSDALYRIRIQDYRIIYAMAGQCLTITIIKIGHRREVYS